MTGHPPLTDMPDDLAEHSATLDHAIEWTPDRGWFCRTCNDRRIDHDIGLDDVCVHCGMTRRFIVEADKVPVCERAEA